VLHKEVGYIFRSFVTENYAMIYVVQAGMSPAGKQKYLTTCIQVMDTCAFVF